MDAIDTLALDRELARVAREWRRWRRGIAHGRSLEHDPFEGSGNAARRVTFDALADLPEHDPLRAPLRAWVYRLMEQRIDRAALCAVASEWSVEEHVIDEPEHARLPLARVLQRALTEAGRRSSWLASLLRVSRSHSEAVSLLWQRRREMAARLGLAHFDALDPSARALEAAAESWLARTADSAREWRSPKLDRVIETSLGMDATHGWPARLSLRSLTDFFRETRLLDGLDLDTGELPRAIAASSFLRALEQVGRAFSDALEPKTLPFVIARDPRGLRRHELGALFGALPLSPAFLRRALDVGAGAIADQRRALARVVLLASRARALCVVLRSAALEGSAALQSAFEEQVERTFGAVVTPALAGSLWRLSIEDGQRFAGVLLAAARAERLCEDHDEDWYRNPRAAERLREETSLPPEVTTDRDALERGAAALSRWLDAALG